MTLRSASSLALVGAALLAACGGPESTASQSAARPSRLTIAPGSNTLVTGLGGPVGVGEIDLTTTTMESGDLDDGAWAVDLSTIFPHGISLGGSTHSAVVHVSTNGFITLDQADPIWVVRDVAGATLPLFAGLASDVNLKAGGKVYAHLDTAADDPVATFTWWRVPPYLASGAPTATDSFQIRLHRTRAASAGDGIAVELRYGELGWTNTSSMSGLDGVGGWSDGNPGTGAAVSMFPVSVGTTRPTNDNYAITYGTQFSTSADGVVTAVRWYGDASVGTRLGRLYAGWQPLDAKHVQLGATASVTPGGASGASWHTIPFATPIPVARGQHYTVALAVDQPASVAAVAVANYFQSAVTSGVFQSPADAGKYALGDAFPDQGFSDRPSYLVDVVFAPSGTGGTHAEITYSGTSDVAKNATADTTATNLTPAQPGVYLFNADRVPARLTATSDASPQSATVSTAFGKPLSATLTDAYGNPLGDVTVTFTAPAAGASAALSSATAVTNAQGVASVTATANATEGTYTVTATAAGLSGAFQLTNTAVGGGGDGGPQPGGKSGCGTGGGASAGLFLPALSALALRLRRRR